MDLTLRHPSASRYTPRMRFALLLSAALSLPLVLTACAGSSTPPYGGDDDDDAADVSIDIEPGLLQVDDAPVAIADLQAFHVTGSWPTVPERNTVSAITGATCEQLLDHLDQVDLVRQQYGPQGGSEWPAEQQALYYEAVYASYAEHFTLPLWSAYIQFEADHTPEVGYAAGQFAHQGIMELLPDATSTTSMAGQGVVATSPSVAYDGYVEQASPSLRGWIRFRAHWSEALGTDSGELTNMMFTFDALPCHR